MCIRDSFVGAISDAIEVLNRIFVGEGTEDTETVTFEEKLRLGHPVQTAFKHQGNRHRDDRTPLGSIAAVSYTHLCMWRV